MSGGGFGGDAVAVVSCAECGADQVTSAAADWYTCDTCHQTFLLRLCPRCSTVVHVPNVRNRVGCPECGRAFAPRRWDRHPVTAADSRAEPGTASRWVKPDPDHRVVAGHVIASGGVDGLRPGELVEIEFTGAAITIWYSTDGGEFTDHDVSYDDVDYLEVTGRGEITTTTGGGVIGGGFGLQGALEGMALASLINSITRKTHTTIETFVHLKARRTEVLLLETTTPPQVLSVRLGPVLDRIGNFRRSDNAATRGGPPRGTVADELTKLSELHQAGLLTAEEFSLAKQRLLGN